jgi:hypothetical protein
MARPVQADGSMSARILVLQCWYAVCAVNFTSRNFARSDLFILFRQGTSLTNLRACGLRRAFVTPESRRFAFWFGTMLEATSFYTVMEATS